MEEELRKEIERLQAVLRSIRDMPGEEQDSETSSKMRWLAGCGLAPMGYITPDDVAWAQEAIRKHQQSTGESTGA